MSTHPFRATTAGIIAAACAVTTLTACGNNNDAAGNTSGKVEGTVSIWYLEDPDTAFMAAVKEGFESKYPGTTVELTELPEDGFVTKVDTAALSKEVPDVAFVYEKRWIKAGQIAPLEDVISKYDIGVDNMNQVALSECRLDEKLYCLGSLTGSVTLIYNKDMFDAAGVEYPSTTTPWTIDEFAGAARQIHQALPEVWGGYAQAPFTWQDYSTHFSEDGRTIESFVDDEATIHVYQTLTDLTLEGVGPPTSETELVIPTDLLAAGRLAMAVTDSEYAAAAMAEAGMRWGSTPPPVETAGDSPYVFVGTDKYGVFEASKNKPTAEALVAYIATEGNQLRVDVSDKPPLDSTLLSQWAGTDEGRQELAQVLSLNSSGTIFVPGFWEVTAPLWDYFSQMANGEADPAPAIKEQAPILQEKLDREWETWESIG